MKPSFNLFLSTVLIIDFMVLTYMWLHLLMLSTVLGNGNTYISTHAHTHTHTHTYNIKDYPEIKEFKQTKSC